VYAEKAVVCFVNEHERIADNYLDWGIAQVQGPPRQGLIAYQTALIEI